MIQVNVGCPHCGASFMDDKHPLDGKDSIKVRIRFDGKKGFLWLSSLYGSYIVESEQTIPPETVTQFFCPYCENELKSTRVCETCAAPMVAMEFSDGGAVQICSRRGCRKHFIEFEDLESELRAFYSRYAPF